MLYKETHKTIIELDESRWIARKELKWNLSKFLCSREVKILSILHWTRWVQQILEQDTPTSFIYQWIPGQSIKNSLEIPTNYFTQLQSIFDVVHEKWIVDVDMSNSNDWLLWVDGNPYLIDFWWWIYRDEIIGQLFFSFIKQKNLSDLNIRKIRYSSKVSWIL